MKTKISRVLLIGGLVAIVAALALSAANDVKQRRSAETKNKQGKFEKKEITRSKVFTTTSSRRVTTKGIERNDYVTVRQLTTNPDEDRFPDWSPDGQEIVFHAEYYYYWGIWKINVDGTGLTPVALPDTIIYLWMCFSRPKYSFDGSKIAYHSKGDTTHGGSESGSIFIMDPDGSNRQRVSLDPSSCYGRELNWSPVENKIVCKAPYDVTDERLCIIDVDAGTETYIGELTPDTIYLYCQRTPPKFSPDGSKILFKSSPEYPEVIDTSGANHIVIDTINSHKSSDWSPDGDKIVYSNDRNYISSGYSDIWIADADGSGAIPILEDDTLCFRELDWQPTSGVANGNWICYTPVANSDYYRRGIWVTTIDGLYQGQLSDDITYERTTPTWSPQGDRIVYSSDDAGNYDIYVIDLDTGDNDYDSLLNWEEYGGYGTDPEDRDTDRGDENDGSEIANGRNPFDPGDDVGAAPPYTDEHNPAPGDTGVSPYTNISLHIKDYGSGVDINSIVMTVEGTTVTPIITGPMHDYIIFYNPPAPFDSGQVIDVTIDASDRAIPPNVMPQDAYSFTITGTGVAEGEIQVPTEFNLFQNTPNPTRYTTTIKFQIPHTAYVTLRIYDASGRLVRTLADGTKEPGYYSLNWDLRDNAGNTVSKGVYYYTLKAGDYSSTMKMVVE